MRRIKVKRSKSGVFGITILVMFICAVVAYNKMELETQMSHKQAEITSLKNKISQLEDEQKEIKNDKILTKEEIEKIAREKLGLAYKDEIIFQPED